MASTAANFPTSTPSDPISRFRLAADGTITLSEGPGLALIGRRPGEVVGLNAYDLHGAQPEALRMLHTVLSGHPAAGRVVMGPYDVDVLLWPLDDGGAEGMMVYRPRDEPTREAVATLTQPCGSLDLAPGDTLVVHDGGAVDLILSRTMGQLPLPLAREVSALRRELSQARLLPAAPQPVSPSPASGRPPLSPVR